MLVVSELAEICGHQDLAYLLSQGSEHGIRVLAGTADTGVERDRLVDLFDSHLVFGLQDEEASTRLLGTPWALTLAEPGRMLVRLGRRKEVEVLGLHLTEDGRRDLLASMGVVETAPEVAEVVDPRPEQRSIDTPQGMTADGTGNTLGQPAPTETDGELQRSVFDVQLVSAAESPVAQALAPADAGPPPRPRDTVVRPASAGTDDQLQQSVLGSQSASAAEDSAVPARSTNAPGEAAEVPTVTVEGPVRQDSASRSQIQDGSTAADAVEIPGRIRRLLTKAPLVVDCEEASVWSADGRLRIGQSSPIEVLLYLAAAPLLHQGRLADWDGVKPETLLAEVWAPRARTPENRDSGHTWLGKNLGRLQDEIVRAAGGLGTEIVVKRRGGLRLNENVVFSDVEAFMAAAEKARTSHGTEQVSAAEEALATVVPGLLSRVVRKPKTAGPKVELYRWLGETHWERAARRLQALGREAGMLLARSYRDIGRHDEALAVYDQLLGEDPLDRRAHEGLLIAAAGTRDVVQLERAWQQVCVCLGGEDDLEARSIYDRLRREINRAGYADLREMSALSTTKAGQDASS